MYSLKGRSILFKEQGEVLLLRFANDLEDYAKVDQMPVLEGKRMTIQLSPKRKKLRKSLLLRNLLLLHRKRKCRKRTRNKKKDA